MLSDPKNTDLYALARTAAGRFVGLRASDREDAIQAAALGIWRARQRDPGLPDAALITYGYHAVVDVLAAIALREGTYARRAAYRAHGHDARPVVVEYDDHGHVPGPSVDALDARALCQCLAGDEAAVVVQVYFGGSTIRDAATVLDKGVTAAFRAHGRALSRMRRACR